MSSIEAGAFGRATGFSSEGGQDTERIDGYPLVKPPHPLRSVLSLVSGGFRRLLRLRPADPFYILGLR